MSTRARSWAWIAAIVLLGSAGAGVVGWRLVRARWARLVPGATLELAIDSAHPFDAALAPDVARRRTLDILRDRVDKIAPTALVRVDGDRVTVLLARGTPPEAVARALTRTGRLEFKVVDDGSDYMRSLAAAVRLVGGDGVELRRDRWTEKDSGAPHEDVYLRAADLAALEHVLATMTAKLPVPRDRELVFERLAQVDGDDEPAWRSYLVDATPGLTGDAFVDVEVSWDQQTGRPEVALALDSDGAKRFEAMTGRAVGRKLAILLEGRVNSAPVVESRIAGGHVRITMGGATDPYQLQQEAKDLVAVLRTGATAAPVTLVELRPPPR